MKTLPIVRLYVFTVIMAVTGGCGNSEPESGGRSGRPTDVEPPSVEIVQAREGALPLELRLNGVVEARNQVIIHPEISGRIDAVLVENGDSVEKGQVLVRFNSDQAEEQVNHARANLRMQEASAAQAQARLRELQIELERMEKLAQRDFVSDLEIMRFRAQVDAAQAELARAQAAIEGAASTLAEREWELSQTDVRAPISGLIGRRNAEVGMRADASTALFVIGDLSVVKVRIRLTERMLRIIRVGQRALIRTAVDATPLEATVNTISPFLDAGSFSTEATIEVPNPDQALRAGMYVDVDILYGESDTATLVPTSAIYRDPRRNFSGVFTAPNIRPTPESNTFDERHQTAEISRPTQIVFQEAQIVAEGRGMVGIRGVEPGTWVVAVGHDEIARRNAIDDTEILARTRVVAWDRLIHLQTLQQHDVLRQFMEQQRRSSTQQSHGTGR